MGFFCNKLRVFDAAPNRAARILAYTIIFTSFTGSALAFTTHHALLDEPVQRMSVDEQSLAIEHVPAPSVADSCLPLLKSIHLPPRKSVTDRNQRSAGKAAALGLVFGVRFALSPLKTPKTVSPSKVNSRFDVWKAGSYKSLENRSALAVTAYRSCRKQQALYSLKGAY